MPSTPGRHFLYTPPGSKPGIRIIDRQVNSRVLKKLQQANDKFRLKLQHIKPAILNKTTMRKIFLSILSCILYIQIHAAIITCPANIVQDGSNRIVNYTVTVTSNCGGGTAGVTVVSSNPSGSQFPIGTTTVTVTATDSCGSTSCSFTVTILCGCPAENAVPALTNLNEYHMLFTDGSGDANWQGASKGFVGNVAINGIVARERTSGYVPHQGYIFTNDNTLDDWQEIVDDNAGYSIPVFNQTATLSGLNADLESAFSQINAYPVTPGFDGVSSTSLNGLNTMDGIGRTYVINVTSGFSVTSQINITGDGGDFGDVFILRWDTDKNFSNGYNGPVKFSGGGAIVPKGGLTAANFINVAGDIKSSGGGTTPPSPYPQGPRTNDGTGSLVPGGMDFSGGGFFTGYWLTTGTPTIFTPGKQPYGVTSPQSNAIFVGGWYTSTTKFSITSGISGVFVGCHRVAFCGGGPADRTSPSQLPEISVKRSFDVAVMPNPSVNDFTLRFTGNGELPTTIRLIDVSGNEISVNTVIDKYSYIIPGSDLPQGIYFAEVSQGNNRKVIKLIKLN